MGKWHLPLRVIYNSLFCVSPMFVEKNTRFSVENAQKLAFWAEKGKKNYSFTPLFLKNTFSANPTLLTVEKFTTKVL